MKPIDFKGTNITFGTNQPGVEPIRVLRTPEGMCITCWELTAEELEQVRKTGLIYHAQLTFNRGLHPQMIATDIADFVTLTRDDDANS
mgnify:CR=1 FL=1